MPPVRARLMKQATPSTFGSSKASTTIRWLAPRILIAVVTSPTSSARATPATSPPPIISAPAAQAPRRQRPSLIPPPRSPGHEAADSGMS